MSYARSGPSGVGWSGPGAGPARPVMRVCQTMVRRSRLRGAHSPRTVPSRPGAKELVFDSSVVVLVPPRESRAAARAGDSDPGPSRPLLDLSGGGVPPFRTSPLAVRAQRVRPCRKAGHPKREPRVDGAGQALARTDFLAPRWKRACVWSILEWRADSTRSEKTGTPIPKPAVASQFRIGV